MKARFLLALIAGLVGQMVPTPSLGKQRETKGQMRARGKALITKAIEFPALKRGDAKPFRLHLKFKALTPSGQYVEGDYGLVWVRDDLWHKEVVLGPRAEVEAATQGKLWTLRNAPAPTAQVFFLENALTPLLAGRSWFKEKDIKKIEAQSDAGGPLTCVKIKANYQKWEFCVRDAEGTLARVKFDSAERSLLEFSDYISLGNQKFPGTIRVTRGRDLLIEAKVTRLEPIDPEKENSKLFEPPSGARQWLWCKDPENWRYLGQMGTVMEPLINRPPHPGRTVIYGVLGLDGKLREVTILWSQDPEWDEGTIRSFRQMRFKPPTCNGQPYEVQVTFLTVR